MQLNVGRPLQYAELANGKSGHSNTMAVKKNGNNIHFVFDLI